MAKVKLYNQEGTSVGTLELPASLFEAKINPALVHEAVVAQQANARSPIAHTKGRGDVAGSGIKPWKQKGTGRARHGSRRSPIWVGGGITFGPTKDRNFSRKMNRSARRAALAMALTDKLAGDHFIAIDTMVLPEAKTKKLDAVLKKFPTKGKKTLLVLEPGLSATARAARNLPRVTAISAKSLNVVDLVGHQYVLASKAAIEEISKTYKS
jgi:large subunit ribosomal protein L4